MIEFRAATLRDAVWLGTRLRPEDEREVRTVTGAAPKWAVPSSFRLSKKCSTMRYTDGDGHTDRNPLAIFGVADDPKFPHLGSVWMLATSRISVVSIAFIKAAPSILDDLGAGYAGLHCLADARNLLHIRWLERCGFSFTGDSHVNGHVFINALRLNRSTT